MQTPHKALWLGRLARPDIIKPIGDLAAAVQKWSRNHDRQLARLIAYIHSTTRYRLVGVIKDNPQDLHLALYADADYVGEGDAMSTSGGFLVLKGPNPVSMVEPTRNISVEVHHGSRGCVAYAFDCVGTLAWTPG